MSILIAPAPAATPLPPSPRNIRWNCEQFHRMGDLGWFEGKSVMLIDGEIKELPGANPPHSTATELTVDALSIAFGPGYHVRRQQPFVLGQDIDPVPDAAVVKGSRRDYAIAHPTTAALVAEISLSSLAYDTGDKANLYAAAGITDYWVVDVVGRQLFVFRDAVADANASHGARYQTRIVLDAAASFGPLLAPLAAVRVADLLP